MPSCSRGRRATFLRALTTTLNVLPCLIRGCKHSLGGVPRTFRTKSAAIRHLTGEGHANSISLVDQSLCREVGIYTCSHSHCPCLPKIFFQTKAEFNRHNAEFHPLPPFPTHRSMSSPFPPHHTASTHAHPTMPPTSTTSTASTATPTAPTATPTTNTYTYVPPHAAPTATSSTK